VAEAERANIKQHESLYEQKFIKDPSTTIGEHVKNKIAKLGENIGISRFVIYEVVGEGVVGNYIHTGAQIGVLLEVKTDSAAVAEKDEFKTLVRDIAMQVAAANPQFVGKDAVDPKALAREREIQRDRARGEGKPDKMLDKIVEGRLGKFYEEVCLLEQPFIRENTLSVAELIKTTSAKLGAAFEVVRFVRFKVGDAFDAPGVEETPIPVSV
jgi:elongation factor Ts